MNWQQALAAQPGAPLSREVAKICAVILRAGQPLSGAEIRRVLKVPPKAIGGRLVVARARGWLSGGGQGRRWDVTDKAREAMAVRDAA